MAGENFTLCIIYKGFVVALLPKVHSLCKSEANVLGPTNAWCCLEDSGNEHQWTFRVPTTSSDTSEFLGENGEETASNLSRGCLVAPRMELDDSETVLLPEEVVNDGTR